VRWTRGVDGGKKREAKAIH